MPPMGCAQTRWIAERSGLPARRRTPVIKLGDYYLLNVAQSWVKGFVNTSNLFFWNVSLSRRS